MAAKTGWQEFFLPDLEDNDQTLRDQMQHLSHIGLRTVAFVCVCAAAFVFAARALLPAYPLPGNEWLRILVIAGPGICLALISRIERAASFSRLIGCIGLFVITVTQIAISLITAKTTPEADRYVAAIIVFSMLLAVSTLALKPVQAFVLGIAVLGTYIFMLVMTQSPAIPSITRAMDLIFVCVIALICPLLAGVIYRERVAVHRAFREALRSFEDLKKAQARLMVSESAASQGRLVAALTHELNSPLAVLKSSVETMVLICRKSQERLENSDLADILESVTRTARQSSNRLAETIERMKRFTNLDRAEVQQMNLNELLRDVIMLVRTESPQKVEISLGGTHLPSIACRPQQLGAVFTTLLRNAAARLADCGRIEVTTLLQDGEIRIKISDNGSGIPADQLTRIFEPSFGERAGRITMVNWGLFNARNIVVDHGGDIEIESTEGKGTIATVRIPKEV
jgi:signal transduction histidine kinase